MGGLGPGPPGPPLNPALPPPISSSGAKHCNRPTYLYLPKLVERDHIKV